MSQTVIRYHDICAGHRVVGHESKCRHLHGHNYRVHFHVRAEKSSVAVPTGKAVKHEGKFRPTYKSVMLESGLDTIGRVIDFSVVKEKLCMWIEDNWDHKFLHWEEDTLIKSLLYISDNDQIFEKILRDMCAEDHDHFKQSLVSLPFNPTAENLAQYLVDVIGPQQLAGTGVELVGVRIEETAKCHVEYFKEIK